MTDDTLHRELERRFAPVLEEISRRAAVTDRLIDKDLYRILMATFWVDVVLHPQNAGLTESQLEPLHDVLNGRMEPVLGRGESLSACFRYLTSTSGEKAMKAARLTPEHRDLLLYVASIIVDPDGHRRWMDEINDPPSP